MTSTPPEPDPDNTPDLEPGGGVKPGAPRPMLPRRRDCPNPNPRPSNAFQEQELQRWSRSRWLSSFSSSPRWPYWHDFCASDRAVSHGDSYTEAECRSGPDAKGEVQ